jgi:hypothetical protein
VHLLRHCEAAQAATTPDSLAHNLRHAKNHVAVTSEHQAKLRKALSQRVPAVGRELDQLDQAISSGIRKSGADTDRGLAHDLSSAEIAAGHVDRHLSEAQAGGGPDSVKFDLEHAMTHILELQHYHGELRDSLEQRLPGVGEELGRLRAVMGLGGTSIPMSPGYPARGKPADYGIETRDVPEPA